MNVIEGEIEICWLLLIFDVVYFIRVHVFWVLLREFECKGIFFYTSTHQMFGGYVKIVGLRILRYSYGSYSYNRCIEQQTHLIKYNLL
jgi:hypothetical protein